MTKNGNNGSLTKRSVQKLASNKLALFGFFLALLIILLCLAAPLITRYDPNYIDTSIRYLPPSSAHWLGTDQNGRDVLARLLYGGRLSILIGLASSLCANALGVVTGCVSGYFGGKTDKVLVYITEIFSCIPSTMLILVVMAFAGQGVGIMILIFALTGWTGTMRMVRSRVLSLKSEPFVESCKANGVSKISIMFSHLLPNTLGIVIINFTTSVANFVLNEAGLSFLGLGVPKGIPTWGNMLNAARSLNVMQNYPILWVAPGIAISLVVLGINFLGDGLRDVFDVKQD
jgi:peptide/nickel transport system permease protein